MQHPIVLAYTQRNSRMAPAVASQLETLGCSVRLVAVPPRSPPRKNDLPDREPVLLLGSRQTLPSPWLRSAAARAEHFIELRAAARNAPIPARKLTAALRRAGIHPKPERRSMNARTSKLSDTTFDTTARGGSRLGAIALVLPLTAVALIALYETAPSFAAWVDGVAASEQAHVISLFSRISR